MNVQQYPFGLLSLLNAKSTGYTPKELLEQLRGTLEFAPYFKAAIPLTSSSSAAATGMAVGTTATLTVPSTEAWELIGVEGLATNGTGADVLWSRVLISPPDASFVGVCVAYAGPVTIGSAGHEVSATWTAPSGLIVGPGTRIQHRLALATGNNVDLYARAIYRPLQV